MSRKPDKSDTGQSMRRADMLMTIAFAVWVTCAAVFVWIVAMEGGGPGGDVPRPIIVTPVGTPLETVKPITVPTVEPIGFRGNPPDDDIRVANTCRSETDDDRIPRIALPWWACRAKVVSRP